MIGCLTAILSLLLLIPIILLLSFFAVLLGASDSVRYFLDALILIGGITLIVHIKKKRALRKKEGTLLPPEIPRCSYCGEPIDASSDKCPSCGAKIQ